MSVKNLLVELFVEELPPKALKKLGEAFGNELFKGLESHDFMDADASLTTFASPRRLAAYITNVRAISPEKERRTKLMPLAVGLDSNCKPTAALIKKLISLGYQTEVDFEAIIKERVTTENDGKSEVLIHTDIALGSPLQVRLEFALQDALTKLPIPKVMAYQLMDGWSTVDFVRPAHSLIALHGADVVPVTALGLTAGNSTHGHRFEAKVSPVVIKNADDYEQQMQAEGAVIASFDGRREEIKRQLGAAANKENLQPIEDEALLDEVTALVERPNVLLGQFETEFLEVPPECLILTMKANQKYFPLLDAKGMLTNKFLIVSNINPADPSAVIGGNERVVRPRLADAKFFFDQDRKKTLESRIPGLSKVVYHNKLGTQGERIERVRAIAKAIAQQLGGDKLAEKADKAAMLAKADLLTDMVGEFPELQGIMGSYYAKHDGHGDDIADAIEDHYKPRFAGDELPRNQVGICVALGDKLETLAGLFSIGQIPTGDKDPFALRRHALGLIRIVVESKLPLDANTLVNIAYATFPRGSDAGTEVLSFIADRLTSYCRDLGYSAAEVDAVVGSGRWMALAIVPRQLAAVRAFAALPGAESLAAANKRVGNILKKVEGNIETEVNTALLSEPAEAALNQALASVKPQADAAFESGDYTASLQVLAALKAPVDNFFDNVMVNAEDPALRANRLALLSQLHAAMNRVADLSKLAA